MQVTYWFTATTARKIENSEMYKIEIEYLFAHIFQVLQYSFQLLEANLTFLWSQIDYFLGFLINNYSKSL